MALLPQENTASMMLQSQASISSTVHNNFGVQLMVHLIVSAAYRPTFLTSNHRSMPVGCHVNVAKLAAVAGTCAQQEATGNIRTHASV